MNIKSIKQNLEDWMVENDRHKYLKYLGIISLFLSLIIFIPLSLVYFIILPKLVAPFIFLFFGLLFVTIAFKNRHIILTNYPISAEELGTDLNQFACEVELWSNHDQDYPYLIHALKYAIYGSEGSYEDWLQNTTESRKKIAHIISDLIEDQNLSRGIRTILNRRSKMYTEIDKSI